VFTDQPFSGNQLAVFPDGGDLTKDPMQKIAREFNRSETTFVFPKRNDASDFHVRIFTPATELPMAGHPTIGTAFVLAHLGMIPNREKVIFEEQVQSYLFAV
jgi:trans-2,3-dihydro-3-hydroxyanthranilate isomerase